MSSPKAALMKGALWTVAMRWSIKVIGFANTVIMARILMPEDYGIVAMAMLVVGLTEALLDFGAASVLLAKPSIDRDDIDSTWTLRLIQGLIVGTLIVCAAYPASLYFEEPRVLAVLCIFGACVAAAGAGNIGFVLAQRELDFYLGFRLGILAKIISVAATLISVWWLGDYRALVVGVAAGYLSGLVLSYWMHPYRARWNTSRIRAIWQTSKWLMFTSLAGFILRKGDELAAARVGTTAEYGQYNVGADLGQLPTGEVGPAMLRAFLPVLSSIQNDVARTRAAVLKTISAVNTITLPIGFIFAAVAPQATTLVLGDKWAGAAAFVALFAIISTVQILLNPINTLLFLRGQARLQSAIVWTEFALFAGAALVLAPLFGILGLAWARLLATCCNASMLLVAGRLRADFPILPVLRTLARPVLGAALAAAAASQISHAMSGNATLLVVLASSATAGLMYVVWSFGTWHLVGRPEGAESTLFDALRQRLAR
jgi:lipopolysaccharide exporter